MGEFARYPSLRGRVVLVTGGGSESGAAAVTEFARQRARVAFLDRRVEASEGLVAGLTGTVEFVPEFVACDLADTEALRAAVVQV